MDLSKEISELYLSGLSAKNVASRLGISSSKVYRELQKANINRRSNAINSRKFYVNEKFFESPNKNNVYWIGAIAADGHIARYKHSSGVIIITQKNTKENELWLKKLLSDADSNYKLKKYVSNSLYGQTEYLKLQLSSGKLYNDIKKYGIVEKKSLTLRPPQNINNLDSHWIRGYFDGDGSASKKSDGIRLRFCGTEEVLEWIADKIPANRVYWSKRNNDDSNNFQIEISRVKEIIDTVEYMYYDADRWLERKRIRCEEFRAKHQAKRIN